MPKFNWKGKTGQTEAQWLQMGAAILAVAGHQFGYEQIAINAGIISQFILGSIGLYLRHLDKKRNMPRSSDIAKDRAKGAIQHDNT